MEKPWLIIINPKSGKKKFRLQRKHLFLALKHANIPFEFRVTKFAGHATMIGKHFAEMGYQRFIVLGGDGTLSETINGLFNAKMADTTKLTIALIPRGTGNDWARFWGIKNDIKQSTKVFLEQKKKTIDIGKVSFELEGEKQTHFFINSIGFGLDALVARNTNIIKRYVGGHAFLYTFAMLAAVFSFKSRKIQLKSKEQQFSDYMFTMNIANGCYSGGGLKQTPDAVPYDGLFDIMLARKPNFVEILGALRLLFKGRLLEHPVIESFQSQNIQLDCEQEGIFEADGIVVNCSSPISISLLPSAIQMIVP